MVTGRGFEEIEHTADWSLRLWGDTMADLLAAAARGMLALTGVEAIPGGRASRQLEIQAADREELLVSWLERLLFELETQSVIPVELTLEAGDTWLRAALVESKAGAPQKPIKAITFHDLEVKQGKDGLEARIVFDV
jgi:SHS2 domain-containing protein